MHTGRDGVGQVRFRFVSFGFTSGLSDMLGTRWDGICFRRFLLDTVPDLGSSPGLVISVDPMFSTQH